MWSCEPELHRRPIRYEGIALLSELSQHNWSGQREFNPPRLVGNQVPQRSAMPA